MLESRIACMCIGALFLGACDNFPSAEQSRWNISSKVDPLTDKQVNTALAMFDSHPFSVQVEINCGGDDVLEYQVATYDEQDKPAPLNAKVSEAGSFGTFVMRLDEAKAQTYASLGSRYNNAISILPQLPRSDFGSALVGLTTTLLAAGMGAKIPNSIDTAKAARVVLKLQLSSGDAVVVIDQNERNVRRFLDDCLANVPASDQQVPEYSNGNEIAEDPQSGEIPVEDVEAVPPPRPSFADYSVATTNQVAELRLQPGTWFWDYRTRLREAYANAPDFGGNMKIALWGCGTGCIFGALMDRSTGIIHEFPLGGEEQQQLDVQIQSGSNLLLANWNDLSGSAPVCAFEAMVWTGTNFSNVSGFPKRVPGTCPLDD